MFRQYFKFFLWTLFLAAGLGSSLAAQTADDRGYIVKVGDKLPPNLQLVLSNGTQTTSESLKGKVVLLQFTASWCSVCRQEMPRLEKEIWQAHKDKGLVMIGIDRDEPMPVVQKFAKTMKITYPLALDPGANIFGLFAHKEAGVTRNVLVDRDGTIVYLTRLYDQKEFSSLKKKVAELMNYNPAMLERAYEPQ